jgi:5'-nucleotidase
MALTRAAPLAGAAFLLAVSLLDAQSPPRSVTISVVGTNDFHGSLVPKDGRGGLALFAGYVANLRAARARDGGGVVVIDAGDMFQGTLASNLNEGATVVAGYGLIGYAAAAIGNHEFDFGPAGSLGTPRSPADDPRGALKARAAEATFPLLAANLLDAATGKPIAAPNIVPSTIVTAAGVNVGIIGVTTRDTLSQAVAANVSGLRVAPMAGTIAAEAFRLRLRGATLVIVAAHAGGRCTAFNIQSDLSSCEADDEIMDVARALPAALVDGIVAGHTHSGMAHEVHGIAITEAFTGGRAFGRVDYSIDMATRQATAKRIFAPRDVCERENAVTHSCDPASLKTGTVVAASYEGAVVVRDRRIDDLIAPAVAVASSIERKPLGIVLDTPLRHEVPQGELPMGNWFVDTLRAATPGADVAIQTLGSLRIDLPPGLLTYGELFELSPFENRLAHVRLSGAELRQVIVSELARKSVNIALSGVRVHATCAGASPDVVLQRESGRPIADDERVFVVTTDFVANGGEGILTGVMPVRGFSVEPDAPLLRDVIADWLTRRGGHIREDKLVDAKNPRWSYPGALPLKCSN